MKLPSGLIASRETLPRPGGTARVAVGVIIATVLVVAAQSSGWVSGSDATLVIMGFDPDRAELITAMVVGAGTATAVGLVTDTFLAAVLVGALGAAGLYADTFWRETVAALAATGTNGSFDLGGWLLTAVTLLTSALIIGWAAATIARPIRRRGIDAGRVVVEAITRRSLPRGHLGRPLAAVAIVLLLASTVPALGDMLNYAPDSLMLHGGPPQMGLVQGGEGLPSMPADGSAGSGAPGTQSSGGTVPPTGSPTGSPTPSPGPIAISSPRPWLAWRPSGQGRVLSATLPAPWQGGSRASIVIYLPPGYDVNGTRRYPVLYEGPTPYSLWDGATNAKVTLDTLIDQGRIPPSMMVFVDAFGGPYPDSECADSFDGREWMDRFIGVTVPGYVDAHFRTIPTPAARAHRRHVAGWLLRRDPGAPSPGCLRGRGQLLRVLPGGDHRRQLPAPVRWESGAHGRCFAERRGG